MGNKVSDMFGMKRKRRILLAGLPNSGKKSVLRYCGHYQFEGLMDFTVLDAGGISHNFNIWLKSVLGHGVDGVIYVIDASDRETFERSKALLQIMKNTPLLKVAPFLIFANKKDLDGYSSREITDEFSLINLKNKWKVVACTAVDGIGVHRGLEWLMNNC